MLIQKITQKFISHLDARQILIAEQSLSSLAAMMIRLVADLWNDAESGF